ncbi:hypothetical protein ABAC402_15490 [Asticcacaulis sp. AC402]|nr:hypothetical protein ABAC402_15490 [Asticcacaulis sp. AC402]
MAGAGLLALALVNPALRGVDVPAASPQAVWNGSWATGFGGAFDKKLALRDPALNASTALSYALFNEGRDGVVPGADGWLYTKEEFDSPRLDKGVADAVAQAVEAKAILEARGIAFVVVIVPAKARIYPEHLGRHTWPTTLVPVYDNLLHGLGNAGIATVDLRPDFGSIKGKDLAYFRTDTHWTPVGAQVAAQTIAKQIAADGKLPSAGSVVPPQLTLAEAEPMDGDLLNFIPLGQTFRHLGPPADRLTQPQFDYTGREESGGLLGDAATPVVLVGTSYSADERWGFAGFLEQALGVDVANLSDKGAGPFVPLRKLLEGTALDESQPEIVIWELPERYVWMDAKPPAGEPKAS